MIDGYVKLIIAKRKTFDQVPKRLQPAVEAALLEKGYDKNGDPIVSEEE